MDILDRLYKKIRSGSDQELLINGTKQMVVVDCKGKVTTELSPFSDKSLMYKEIQTFALREKVRLDPLKPAGGGILELPGYPAIRWHSILPPVAEGGPLLSLRKMSWGQHDFSDFQLSFYAYSELLKKVKNSCVFLSGPTGSGKSTFLSMLMESQLVKDRVFVLESLSELPLLSPNWLRLVEQFANLEGKGEFGMKEMLRESLRMRPDHFVLGEIRGQEAEALYQLILGTHGGVWATIHTNGPDALIPRLANLSLRSESNWLDLFRRCKPVYIQLQRKEPRISGLYQYSGDGFSLLTFDQKPV